MTNHFRRFHLGSHLPTSERAFSQHEDVENDHFRLDHADSLVGRADRKTHSVSRDMPAEVPMIDIDDQRHPQLTVDGRKIRTIRKLGCVAEDGCLAPFIV